MIETLLDELNIVSYRLNSEDGTLTALSMAIESLSGYPREDFLAGDRTLASLIEEGDRTDKQKTVGASLRDKIPYSVEYRITRQSGEMRWILDKGMGSYDPDGNLTSISGILTDVTTSQTRRLEAEKKVRVLQQAVEQAPNAIVITDPDGSICYVNQSFLKITGYTRMEVLGQNPRVLKLNTEAGIDYQELWQTILAGKPWHGIFQNQKKNGEAYWEQAVIAPIYDDDGKLYKFVGMKQDITAEHENKREMEKLYHVDMLTKVYNRRSFFKQAEAAFGRIRMGDSQDVVFMLDIDFFKLINDSHGHGCGDDALRLFATVCKNSIRKTDLIGRIGGEEFAIYLSDTRLSDALVTAERLRENVEKCRLVCDSGETVTFTVSIGIAVATATDQNFDAVLKRADAAMYQAKQNGRNRVETLL